MSPVQVKFPLFRLKLIQQFSHSLALRYSYRLFGARRSEHKQVKWRNKINWTIAMEAWKYFPSCDPSSTNMCFTILFPNSIEIKVGGWSSICFVIEERNQKPSPSGREYRKVTIVGESPVSRNVLQAFDAQVDGKGNERILLRIRFVRSHVRCFMQRSFLSSFEDRLSPVGILSFNIQNVFQIYFCVLRNEAKGINTVRQIGFNANLVLK